VSATLLAVPNISEGRDAAKIAYVAGEDALLDVHIDPDHNRSVLTYGGDAAAVTRAVAAMIERAVSTLDIRTHTGAHPRFGVVDVLPFVGPDAERAATGLVWTVAEGCGVPVHFYGRVASDGRTLPQLRRWLRETKPLLHPSAGVICIGARDPLVAFNVTIEASLADAKRIANQIRDLHLRALGFELPSRGLVQVSMNLVDPLHVGPKEALARLAAKIVDCEIVGLVPDGVATDGLPLRTPARTVSDALRNAQRT
jgi:glutamate formiminotransferase